MASTCIFIGKKNIILKKGRLLENLRYAYSTIIFACLFEVIKENELRLVNVWRGD
jgi:hypothetical protein